MRKEVNLNHESINILELENGQTVFRAKVGRVFYNIHVNKNMYHCYINVSEINKNYSEYYVSIKNTTVINRKFIENIKKISEAETILKTYRLI